MKIRPLSDRVVIKRNKEQVTPGGIALPDNAKDAFGRGKVIAVGPGRSTDEDHIITLEVQVGDEVLFAAYTGADITVDGESFLILRESEIHAVIS